MNGAFSRDKVDEILGLIPSEVKACYTGQSILAYCPEPTFTFDELNTWPDETDLDVFCYTKACLSSLVQLFMCHGWQPASDIERFKAERIRYWDDTTKRRFKLQTVGLELAGYPKLNLSWHDGADDVIGVVKRFDMDYLMVGMDIRTRTFIDLRGPDHRVAHVNHFNAKFDIADVDVMFWARQFDRCPKGMARGIDTRPVARQYIEWVEETLARGDWASESKTRLYADRKMEQSIEYMMEGGFDREQAERIYHLCRQEDARSWAGTELNLRTMLKQMQDWLASVED
jgi:hypothetical protein